MRLANVFAPVCALFAVSGMVPAQGAVKTVLVKVTVDSQHGGYEGYRALDGNPQTMWHTRFNEGETRHPHHITLDLGANYQIAGFGYLPRSGAANGTIKDYEFYVGDDPKELGKPVVTGSFVAEAREQVVQLAKKANGRYVRLQARSEVRGLAWTSVAELRLLVDGVVFRAAEAKELNIGVATTAGEWQTLSEIERQYRILQIDIQRRTRIVRHEATTYRAESLILDADRDPVDVVLRRTAALLADLQSNLTVPI